jgi:hypothetical protein
MRSFQHGSSPSPPGRDSSKAGIPTSPLTYSLRLYAPETNTDARKYLPSARRCVQTQLNPYQAELLRNELGVTREKLENLLLEKEQAEVHDLLPLNRHVKNGSWLTRGHWLTSLLSQANVVKVQGVLESERQQLREGENSRRIDSNAVTHFFHLVRPLYTATESVAALSRPPLQC